MAKWLGHFAMTTVALPPSGLSRDFGVKKENVYIIGNKNRNVKKQFS